jgi:hypothetical protein
MRYVISQIKVAFEITGKTAQRNETPVILQNANIHEY